MPRFVVLLRGVNVGKGNRVPMAELRRLLADQGYGEVRTLLNSGNAVFTSAGRSAAKHAGAIAGALRDGLGVDVPVVVKEAAEYDRILAENPITVPAEDHSRFLVAFAQQKAAIDALEPLASRAEAPERLVIGPRAAYLHCPAGILESPVAKALLGKAGRGVTTRNWATALKLGALLRADAG